ncbi:MAG: 2-oxoglutarate dehydrogenase complex dihydrolipoyllysine-residue succinyltransferase [Neisseriaceae bacterium]
MIVEIKVPVLPESVTEATLISWNVKVGDTVAREQNLIDIETDKVVLELPSPDAGTITEITVKDGATVVGEQVIAKLDTSLQANGPSGAKSDSNATETKEIITPKVNTSEPKIAMPSAAKIITEKNLSIDHIHGSGKSGRILKEDVANLENSSLNIAVPAAISDSGQRPEQRVPMTRLRQRVAERLIQSQAENALLTTFNEVNMKPIIDLRSRYKDTFQKENNVKLGFMSFFIKAAVIALKKYPVLNASIDGNDIVYHGYFDIGIAVSSPRGLVVPIIKDADLLTVAEIEKKIIDFAARAQAGKLTLEEITGGTFSITNGGTFGSMMSTPIINPPQSAILGMHAIYDRPIVEDGAIVVRPMMYLALSYDHRLIDGREAVLSLVTIKQMLEDPARLFLEN